MFEVFVEKFHHGVGGLAGHEGVVCVGALRIQAQLHTVRAVVDIYGPSDLAADNAAWMAEAGVPSMPFAGTDPDDGRAPLDQMMCYITTDEDMLPFISPIAYVHRDIPPVLILQGEADPIVPKQHSILLARRIAQVCGPERVDLRLYPERTHADRDFMTDETAHTVVEFLDKYFKQ